MNPLRNHVPKTALITGAAQRIGRTIALDLVKEGFAVALHAHSSREQAQEMARLIHEQGGKACVVYGDLNDAQAPSRIMGEAVEHIGEIGVLINNASLFEPDTIGSLQPVLWDRHFNINVRAPVMLAQVFDNQLKAGNHGVIINMIDQRVWKLTPQFMSYTLSKAALLTATTTLAQALAPRIRVMGIGPGPTLANSRQSPADFQRQSLALPLGHGPDPDEITETVRFILRNQSMTGQMIAVDGGQHIVWQTADVVGIQE